jgi:hypothetical protein
MNLSQFLRAHQPVFNDYFLTLSGLILANLPANFLFNLYQMDADSYVLKPFRLWLPFPNLGEKFLHLSESMIRQKSVPFI